MIEESIGQAFPLLAKAPRRAVFGHHDLGSRTVSADVLLREIVAAARLVHETLGPGFLESIYVRALLSELRSRGVFIERERQVKIWYRSHVVGKHKLDLVVERTVIVELKANHGLVPVHAAQLRSYLQATDCRAGILLNFGTPALQWEVLHRQEIAEKTE